MLAAGAGGSVVYIATSGKPVFDVAIDSDRGKPFNGNALLDAVRTALDQDRQRPG